MKTTLIAILVLSFSAAGCSAMLEFKDYGNELCGNGELDGVEECDEGAANSDELADACRTSCRTAHCGDNVTDSGETCDSGDNNGQPGRCNNACDGYVPDGSCGNGQMDPGEVCDDGSDNGRYGFCLHDCTGFGPRCGDGVVQADFEECDGPNLPLTTCEELGSSSGLLSCDATCQYDTSLCIDEPICSPAQTLTCGAGSYSGFTTDSGSRNGLVGHCGGESVSYTGREMVFSFISPANQQVELSLTTNGEDLDLFVMEANGPDCGQNGCVTASLAEGGVEERVSFAAIANSEYFVIVDGYDGQQGPFDLNLRCLAPESCTNTQDDNGNGLVDCDDLDCFNHSLCMVLPETLCSDSFDQDGDGDVDCLDQDCISGGQCVCDAAETVACGDAFMSSNGGPGSSSKLSNGWCLMAGQYTGPERVYEFIHSGGPDPQTVTFALTQLTADVDLFGIQSNNGPCHAGACATGPKPSSAVGGLGDEVVTIDYTPGMKYYFAVDGWNYAKGQYQVQVSCNF